VTECPIPCNLCGASDVDVIGTRDRTGRPLRTTICRRCGLVWSNPRPASEDVRRYYSAEYRLDYKGRATPSLRQVARSGRGALNRYRVLKPYLHEGARVLDAGAGGGEVVYVLRRLGVDASGLEPDERYARHAREVLGVPVSTGFIQDVEFPAASFDVVTMYHALEHVEDPLAILSRLRSWMTEGGVLLIEVPHVEAACISPSNRFHVAHLYHFNAQTLNGVAAAAGFDSVDTALSSDGGNVIGVFRAASGPTREMDRTNYERVVRRVKGHTTARYYASRWPYVGPVHRLRAYLKDRRAAAHGRTPAEVLDKLTSAYVDSR
jgi:SAM-dependent methyltransferase